MSLTVGSEVSDYVERGRTIISSGYAVNSNMELIGPWPSVAMAHGSLVLGQQEAEMMLTNPRDAFSGQSRSPNIVPIRCARYGFLLVDYSNCS